MRNLKGLLKEFSGYSILFPNGKERNLKTKKLRFCDNMSFKKICICLILIFCIIGAASAAEDVSTDVVDASDDAVAVSDDVAVDEVVSEVDSADESIAVENDKCLESVDDSVSDSLAVQDDEQANDVEEVDLLSDNVVILYVNGSMLQDEELLPDGSSWETAVGAPFSIYIAPGLIIDNGGTEGIIYIAKGDYSDNFNLNSDINITFVGYDEDTILPDISTPVYGSGAMM